MTKHADPETLQRKRWLKALRIAHILFEEDGYHTKYLSEIEAFIRPQAPEPQAPDEDPKARVDSLIERMRRVDWSSHAPNAPWESLGQIYEDVRNLIATDQEAAKDFWAKYASAICTGPAAQSKDASDTCAEASAQAEPPAPAASRYHIDHYPYSRFWAVHDGKDLVAVTVYRKGAKEVTERLEAQDRTIAELKRQIAALSMPHP